jgi:hypothetical protein
MGTVGGNEARTDRTAQRGQTMTSGRSAQQLTQHPFAGRAVRDLAQLAAEALAAGLVVSLVLALAIFIATTQVQAAPVAAVGANAAAPSASPAAER